MGCGFTNWESGLYGDELEHFGISGMHWGQRRYQNPDGSLTAEGKARYGYGKGEGTKRTSARKMQRDFNNLDKGYANVAAEKKFNQRKTAKYARKGHKAERKGKNEKARKYIEKSLKYANKAALNNKQQKSIEALQWKIIGKAASKGYTTNSRAVKRMGVDRRGRVAMAIGRQFGAVGGAASGGYAGRHSVVVDGQKVSIKRRGNGGTNVINYAHANQLAAQERERERARKMAKIRR